MTVKPIRDQLIKTFSLKDNIRWGVKVITIGLYYHYHNQAIFFE